MNIKVQRQKPGRGEGAQGELRLVMVGRGAFLFIKGGNQWHSLSLVPNESVSTDSRQKRGDLERNIKKVVDFDANGLFTASGNAYLDEAGAIMDPSGKGRSSAKPDAPL